jgi:acyl-CoA thioesterase I
MKKMLFLLSIFLMQLNLVIADINQASQIKKILFLGDSLTAGYGIEAEQAFPSLVEKMLRERDILVKAINAGESGASSASAYPRLKWLIKQKPDLIVLALGSNDGLRGQPIEQIKQNLEQAIKLAQEHKIALILVGMQMPPNYGKDYTKKFSLLYKDLAKHFKLPLVDFLLEGVAGVAELNLSDGIHPNPSGHKIMAKTVLKVIQEHL